jgi:predicted nucleic acid-binding protein
MTGVLVDSSLVLDLFTDDPIWGERSRRALAEAAAEGDLLIDDMVYAEVSVGFSRIEELDEALGGAGFTLAPMPRAALFLAGKAFLAYRKRGGAKTSPLPDFIIGAHAAVSGLPLLTRDPARVRSAYPKLELILVE